MPRATQPTKPSTDPSTGSVWTRPQRSRREQPALSRDQIVAEAIALLDADGIEALSMRKLGTRLNAGATSLYTHVSNKDELIELVVDQVYGEIEVPKVTSRDEWRAAALECGNNARAVILGHPWIASVLGEMGMSYLGPNMLRLTEDMLELFESGGFDLDQGGMALKTIWSYILGIAATEAAWMTALVRSGQSEDEWLTGMASIAEQAIAPYPRMRRMHAEQTASAVGETRRSNFDQGLECILDGLEAQRRQ